MTAACRLISKGECQEWPLSPWNHHNVLDALDSDAQVSSGPGGHGWARGPERQTGLCCFCILTYEILRRTWWFVHKPFMDFDLIFAPTLIPPVTSY
jgi:hypothetical protein